MTFDRLSTTDAVLSGVDLTGKSVLVTGAETGRARAVAVAPSSPGIASSR